MGQSGDFKFVTQQIDILASKVLPIYPFGTCIVFLDAVCIYVFTVLMVSLLHL